MRVVYLFWLLLVVSCGKDEISRPPAAVPPRTMRISLLAFPTVGDPSLIVPSDLANRELTLTEAHVVIRQLRSRHSLHGMILNIGPEKKYRTLFQMAANYSENVEGSFTLPKTFRIGANGKVDSAGQAWQLKVEKFEKRGLLSFTPVGGETELRNLLKSLETRNDQKIVSEKAKGGLSHRQCLRRINGQQVGLYLEETHSEGPNEEVRLFLFRYLAK